MVFLIAEHNNTCLPCSLHRRRSSRSNRSSIVACKLCQAYTAHLVSQWCDRQIYWHARDLSQRVAENMHAVSLAQCLVCIMADGMDQAKFAIPRSNRAKVKGLDKFARPLVHVGGVWAHGWSIEFHACLPDVRKDANANIESISRSLDRILARAGSLPPHIWLQQDNAPNQCKNQKMFRWSIYTVIKGSAQV